MQKTQPLLIGLLMSSVLFGCSMFAWYKTNKGEHSLQAKSFPNNVTWHNQATAGGF